MEMAIPFILLGLFLAIIIAIWIYAVGKEAERQLRAEFPNAKIFVNKFKSNFIALDFDTSTLAVSTFILYDSSSIPKKLLYLKYDFSQIVKAEVIKDGVTIGTTNRGSQAAGAAIGALAFGGIGAILGGLSGPTRSEEKTTRISINIVVDDLEYPNHEIIFFTAPGNDGMSTRDVAVEVASKKVADFAAFIDAAIRKSQAGDQAKQAANIEAKKAQVSSKPLWADKDIGTKLRQLRSLLDDGSISDKEYDLLKTHVMAEIAPTSIAN
jgi:hypothetical protein